VFVCSRSQDLNNRLPALFSWVATCSFMTIPKTQTGQKDCLGRSFRLQGSLGSLPGGRNPINICSLARHFSENVCKFDNQKCEGSWGESSFQWWRLPREVPTRRFEIAGVLFESHQRLCASSIGSMARNTRGLSAHLPAEEVIKYMHPSSGVIAAPHGGTPRSWGKFSASA
jgi:hypothetical protein